VDWVSVQHGRHQLRRTEEAFEDGTPNFWAIAALAPGFAFLEQVGMRRLSARVTALTGLLLDGLRGLVHDDGSPAVTLYGPTDVRERGGTVACNLVGRRGAVIDYETVEGRAREAGVAVRGGCFCNPGCSEVAFGFTEADSLRCLEQASAAGFTPRRFAECMGDVAVGAVRLSVGVATTAEDVRRAVEVLGTIAGEAR
jgi:selenocysteine lyase/cysteine desulfurase